MIYMSANFVRDRSRFLIDEGVRVIVRLQMHFQYSSWAAIARPICTQSHTHARIHQRTWRST